MRALFLAAAVVLAGCNLDPYTLEFGGADGGPGPGDPDADLLGADAGPKPDAMRPPDAAVPPDACLPSFEVCDGVDNNCNGVVDEGFDKTSDPNNCGTCGNACLYPGAFGACQASVCVETGCKPGFVDTDPGTPGCDYACIETNGGVEKCDLVDNDCDLGQPGGGIDEDFSLDDDVDNCGACGNVCALLHATAQCVDVDMDGLGKCEVLACEPGFVDNNPAVPGCEYQCTPTNGGVEICDGIDNDCDSGKAGGGVDEGSPGSGVACGTDEGVCSAGTTVCTFGILQCVGATGGGPEVCDDLDNDCDGTVDDGFDKDNDILHCGGCSPCNVPFATPSCTMGVCGIQACQAGHHNNDMNPANGCEYACVLTGSELCDGIDNDCDLGRPGGGIDEGFDKQTDPLNCGTCGNTCSFPHATALCQMGGCVQGACDAGFHDNNPLIAGCEYACTITNGGVEICDGLDNDCDNGKPGGGIDEGNPGGGVACGTDVGECSTGTRNCVAGQLVCQGGQGPVAESCNNKDDDCDTGQPGGGVDEGFDKQNDPTHCGMTCQVCSFANAVPACTNGVCGIGGCLPGFADANGLPGDGCELFCTPSGVEICDGLDNDCDNKLDDADDSLVLPANFCDQQGECMGTEPTCQGAAGWACVYADADVEKDLMGNVVLEESLCDNKDNDCDGGIDEPYEPLKNDPCREDGTFGTVKKNGVCRGTGTLQCNSAQMPPKSLRCNVTMAGAAASNEVCDNRDNDCDGFVDELWNGSAFPGAPSFNGVVDATVTINAGGALGSYEIYDFEASRPDALSGNAGFVETRACSVSGRRPWASADFDEATAACAAAGMRLCRVVRTGCAGGCCTGGVTADEWGRACQADGGADPLDADYPYGTSYNANTCNGSDFDPIAGGVNEDQAVDTGSRASCVSSDGVNDLSGNLKEWTNDPRCTEDGTVYTLRGGSFDNGSGGLTCDFNFTVAPPDFEFTNVGFRCCSAVCANGLADCGGTCRNLGNDANNCGACGNSCGGGVCSNGKCCPSGQVNCNGECCASGSCVAGVCQ